MFFPVVEYALMSPPNVALKFPNWEQASWNDDVIYIRENPCDNAM